MTPKQYWYKAWTRVRKNRRIGLKESRWDKDNFLSPKLSKKLTSNPTTYAYLAYMTLTKGNKWQLHERISARRPLHVLRVAYAAKKGVLKRTAYFTYNLPETFEEVKKVVPSVYLDDELEHNTWGT